MALIHECLLKHNIVFIYCAIPPCPLVIMHPKSLNMSRCIDGYFRFVGIRHLYVIWEQAYDKTWLRGWGCHASLKQHNNLSGAHTMVMFQPNWC